MRKNGDAAQARLPHVHVIPMCLFPESSECLESPGVWARVIGVSLTHQCSTIIKTQGQKLGCSLKVRKATDSYLYFIPK